MMLLHFLAAPVPQAPFFQLPLHSSHPWILSTTPDFAILSPSLLALSSLSLRTETDPLSSLLFSSQGNLPRALPSLSSPNPNETPSNATSPLHSLPSILQKQTTSSNQNSPSTATLGTSISQCRCSDALPKLFRFKRSRSSIWRCIFDTLLHCHNFLLRNLVQKQKPQGHEFLT